MKLIDFTVGMFLIIYLGVFCYKVGYNASETSEAPVSDLFWIDDNRVHIDSIIDCSPIYDDTTLEVIGSWIRVSYGETVIHIECLTTDDYLWYEFKESWLMAFNERLGV